MQEGLGMVTGEEFAELEVPEEDDTTEEAPTLTDGGQTALEPTDEGVTAPEEEEELIGAAPTPEPLTIAELEAAAVGVYPVTIAVTSDPAGHRQFIGLADRMNVVISVGSINISGPAPWVNVSGDLAEDSSFTATGRGIVAGFSNIAVTFEGTITLDGQLTGDYTMGAEGRLPGGQPIVYRVEGQVE